VALSILLAAVDALPMEVIDIVDGRANILLTTFLTTIAFKLFVSDKLPNLSYLSLIDYYILLCLLVQISMIISIQVSYQTV
jgi:hypothetical protein